MNGRTAASITDVWFGAVPVRWVAVTPMRNAPDDAVAACTEIPLTTYDAVVAVDPFVAVKEIAVASTRSADTVTPDPVRVTTGRCAVSKVTGPALLARSRVSVSPDATTPGSVTVTVDRSAPGPPARTSRAMLVLAELAPNAVGGCAMSGQVRAGGAAGPTEW